MKAKPKIVVLEKNEFIKVMKECFTKLNRMPPKSLEVLEMNLEEIGYCFDCATDAFCEFGLELNDEPNPLGLEIEKAITTLQIMMDNSKKRMEA